MKSKPMNIIPYIILLIASISFSNSLLALKKNENGLYLGYCISSISGDDNHAEELNTAIKAAGLDLDFPMSKDPKMELFKRN